jgi:hypothetical protein
MFHEIGGDEIDAFRVSDERFKRGPFRLELLFAR